MTTINSATGWYGDVFKGWQVKQLGAKPTAEQLAAIHDLGARPGKQALACAMALREAGVTGAQIIMACGAPQLNKMRGFVTDKLLKRVPASPDAKGHQVYKLELTSKAEQRIASARKRADAVEQPASEADKPADAVKAKKATKVASKAKRTSKAAKALEGHNPFEGAPLIENQPSPVEPQHVTDIPANNL